ncbi:hypothetical protein [uncultured Bilophila sp.]|uniref:hypothetical protein n=1 Tax=uncultured Bilophila sp. TaxID=529385 RepID=UPI0026DBAE95|nr:hypothetical protein [uncultured Bilophila sp.]
MLLFDDGKKLEKAVGEEAARAIIETLEKYDENQKNAAATKGDLRETELRLQKEMKEMELRLLKWQIGGWVALAAIMAKGFGWLGF